MAPQDLEDAGEPPFLPRAAQQALAVVQVAGERGGGELPEQRHEPCAHETDAPVVTAPAMCIRLMGVSQMSMASFGRNV